MGFKDPSTRLRVLELALVTSVAFAGPVFGSLYYFFGEPLQTSTSGQMMYALINELLAISVLVYVLFRQGRRFGEIGFGFVWRDVPRSLALTIGGYIAYYGCFVMIYYSHYAFTGQTLATPDIGSKISSKGVIPAGLVFAVVNPFFEELIVRAYLMTELRLLTGSAAISIATSVLLQTLYHLYQGVPLAAADAAMFSVFALYFSFTLRIMPVVLAHLAFDLFAFSFAALRA